MGNTILIIGNHPISADLTRQYRLSSDEAVCWTDDGKLADSDLAAVKEFVLLSDYSKQAMQADNEVMGVLLKLATHKTLRKVDGKRPLCHLLLRGQSLLHMIRLEGFRQEIEDSLEVNAFTMEDQWSQMVALALDREPIMKQTEKTIHLVIFGMSDLAELIAINAAHVCHFPNYLQKDHSLRTRITLINKASQEKCIPWLQKYKALFDNSYYRFVDASRKPAVTYIHKPMYADRGDFVDIEWEFVTATPYDVLVRNKLNMWATSPSQLLTVVFAYDNSEEGLNAALHLPEDVGASSVPVYVYMSSDEAFRQIRHSGNMPHIMPFGMSNYGYDINIPLVRMAKNVNYIYDRCYEENDRNWDGHLRFSVEIDEEQKELSWARKSGVKRMSSICNAMTIGVKMRSMGFKEDEWEKFFDMSQEEIETLSEVEHNRWSVGELLLGWRPCNDQEQREVEADINMKEELKKRKIHYDLRTYHDLRPDATGRSVQLYDRCLSACIPLIAKESRGGKV